MNIKRGLNSHKNKYFIDVFLIVLVFILSLSLTILSIIEYHRLSMLKQEERNREFIVLENYANKIDKEMKDSFEYIDLLLLEPLTREFIENGSMNQYNKIQLYQHIKDTSPRNNLSQAQVIMYKPETDCFISKNGIEHLYDMRDKYGNIPYKNDEFEKFADNKPFRLSDEYTGVNENEYIVFFIRKTVLSDKNICFLIVLNNNAMKENMKNEALKGFYINENECNLFVYNTMPENNKNEIIHRSSAVITGWEYGFVTDVFKIPVIYAIRLSILFLFIILLSFYVSKYIAVKIYELFSSLSQKILNESVEYGEIDTIRIAYEKMLGKKKELMDNSEINVRKLKNIFLKRIFTGEISKTEIEEKMELFSLGVIDKFCCAMCIATVEDQPCVEAIQSELYRELMEKMILELSAESFEMNLGTTVILYPWNKNNSVESILLADLSNIEQKLDLKIKAVIVDYKFNSFYDIIGLHSEIICFYENQLRHSDNIVFHYSYEEKKNIDNKYYYPLEIENKFISFVQEGNKEACYDLIYNIIDINAEKKHLSFKMLDELELALFITVKHIMEIYELSESDLIDSANIREKIVFSRDKEKLKELLCKTYDNVFKAIAAKNEEKNNLLFSEINDYVIDNFEKLEEMAVANIAARFNISVGYISKLYKRMTGQTFIDYVMNLRINEAKKLLRENRLMKVKDVGESVGYLNTSSFLRAFKKKTGLSPNEYRSKCIAEKE